MNNSNKGVIMKNKTILLFLAGLVVMLWCIKGYWHNAAPTNGVVISQDIQQRFDKEDLFKKEKLLADLQVEMALLRKNCPSAQKNSFASLPIIYAVTPTHHRAVQKADLTRLSHTLMLVPNLHWIIVEDSGIKTDLVTNLLAKTGMSYTHLNAATPANWKIKAKEPRWNKPRGVIQRNTALEWIRNNVPHTQDGVIYFVDDDNTYSLEVFEEMRYVRGVGVWPVGLVGGLMVERPKVNDKGKVIGWRTVWSPQRPFAIDMAGFAINIKLFHSRPEGKFAFESEKGYQESELLKHFVARLDELEVKAQNCTKVYVWHTRTEATNLNMEDRLKKEGRSRSDVGIEV